MQARQGPDSRHILYTLMNAQPWVRLLTSAGLVALVTLIGIPLVKIIDPTNLVMVYLVAVVLSASYLGRGPSVLAAILSVLALDFFFIPPHFTFAVADTQYITTFVGLLLVGLVISELTTRVRDQAEATRRRERQTAEQFKFSRDLASAVGLAEIVQAIVTHIGETFGTETVVWLERENGLTSAASTPGLNTSERHWEIARDSFQQGGSIALLSDTDANPVRVLPLKTSHGVVGALGLRALHGSLFLPPEQRLLLESFASQAALGIERAQLAEQARQAQLMQATEKLETALLNSISHDLRTPLVSITGTLSSLQEDENDPSRQSMIETAYAEARRLNHLVGNLLDMTRIQAGAMRPRLVSCDVQDVVGSAIEQLSERLKGRQLMVSLAPDLPLVPMDFVLIVQVLVNLLDNSIKYSPAEQPIQLVACLTGKDLEIRVEDWGIGIPASELDHVFDKFYRVRRPDGVIGTGLGLSICKGIAEAHRGQIRAENRAGGGTIMRLRLPLGTETSHDG